MSRERDSSVSIPTRGKRNASVVENAHVSTVWGVGKGRSFGSWIDEDGRDNGYDELDVIKQPAYIIESILRDEMGLTSSQIDYESFDIVGNTTDGLRKDWVFASSITTVKTSLQILSELCYESFCILFEGSDGKYRLVALDTDTVTPYEILQNQMFPMQPQVGRSAVNEIRNQFIVNYRYNYLTNIYERNFVVDENGSTLSDNTFTVGSFTPAEVAIDRYGGEYIAGYYSLCSVSQTRFLTKKKMEVDLVWITDNATAELFTKKLVEWMYAPHITMSIQGWWGESTSPSRKHFLCYELGDQVKVNHPLLNPTVSSAYVFMITGKTIDRKNNSVILTLMAMR